MPVYWARACGAGRSFLGCRHAVAEGAVRQSTWFWFALFLGGTILLVLFLENRFPGRDYIIRFECADFTSLCPITGQPDFATIEIEYIPDRLCIETKSLKYYLASYRNSRAFNEEIANGILDDLVSRCAPRQMAVRGQFASRGGITLSVEAEHRAPEARKKSTKRR